MKRWMVLAVLVCAWSAVAAPRLVQVGDEPVKVFVRAGEPQAVTFPEDITMIPTGVNPADLSLEMAGRRLFIQALVEGFEARLYVIGRSGRMYELELMEGEEGPDGRVELVIPVAAPRFGEVPVGVAAPEKDRGRRGRRGGSREDLVRRLMLSMLEGRRAPGVRIVDHAEVLFEGGGLRIETVRVFLAGRYLGYVAKAENVGKSSVALLLPEYQADGLRAIAAAREQLGVGESTLMYLVTDQR